jgi:hypothetical protein
MEHRVLVIESINDRLSRNRAGVLANSPQLEGLVVEHCYAVNPTQEDLEGIDDFQGPRELAEYAAWEGRGASLSYAELKKIVETAVQDFKPDAIMLHTGIVFHRHSQTFIRVLNKIKSEYPHIRIGYQYRPSDEYLAHYPVFDFDEMTCEIELKLFGRIPPR